MRGARCPRSTRAKPTRSEGTSHSSRFRALPAGYRTAEPENEKGTAMSVFSKKTKAQIGAKAVKQAAKHPKAGAEVVKQAAKHPKAVRKGAHAVTGVRTGRTRVLPGMLVRGAIG